MSGQLNVGDITDGTSSIGVIDNHLKYGPKARFGGYVERTPANPEAVESFNVSSLNDVGFGTFSVSMIHACASLTEMMTHGSAQELTGGLGLKYYMHHNTTGKYPEAGGGGRDTGDLNMGLVDKATMVVFGVLA